MANPQIENGYTRIANEILDHLAMPGISGSELRIVIFVLRKTYGFGKKSDYISLSQFQKGTLMNRAHVVRTLKELVHKRVLLKDKSTYGINKNWETWVVHKRVPSTQMDTGVVHKRSTPLVHKRVHTKETITKETIQKKERAPYEDSSDFFRGLGPYEELLGLFSKGRDGPTIKKEFEKFTLYWTEKNQSGMKERWQTQKTFEVKRRLLTWLSKMNSFNSPVKKPVVII